MPIYEYRCEQGHTFEVMQRIADDPVTACATCEAPVTRVFHPIAVHFKGSGFYNTDYGTRNRAREKEGAEAAAQGSSGAEGKTSESGKASESTSSGSDGAKPDSKPSDATKPGPKRSEAKTASTSTPS